MALYIFDPQISPSYHINFLDKCLSAKITNTSESNNIKFHKSLSRRNWDIGGFKHVGVQDRAFKLYPGPVKQQCWQVSTEVGNYPGNYR